MLKHLHNKYFKKNHHHKKTRNKILEGKQKESMPFFVTFSISNFGLLFFLIPALIGIWAIVSFEVIHNNKFYPGVFVGGEPVGGQTYTEALKHFKEKAYNLQKDGLTATFESSKGLRKINIPMYITGLTPDNSVEYFTLDDWEKDLQMAYKWGHGTNIFRDAKQQLTLLFKKKNFNFSTDIQKEAVESLIENELSDLLKKGVPASFTSAENKIFISKEKIGEKINKDQIMDVLNQKLTQFNITPTFFKTQADIPTATQENLLPYLDFAENLSNEISLVFQYQKHEWKIKGPKLVTWLTLKKEAEIGIDDIKLENYLTNTVAKFINNPPKNSRFEIRKEKLVEVALGKSGNAVNINKTIQMIEKEISEIEENFNNKIIPSQKNSTIYVPIEIIEVEPKVTKETVEKYKIKDLVGEVRTNFEGSSADREHNIKIGVETINGILIAPGAEFSTIEAIGSVTGKEGYVKETVIKKDRTAKEYGGGLCQVATTLFRLALNTGLSITERINHRFVINYYNPPGLDAAIYGPHPDLRFVNDTENYLLLQARIENKQVIMELYGQKDGRSVEISKPTLYNKIPAPKTKYIPSMEYPIGKTKCFETPHDGITASVLYTVNYSDGTTKKKNFLSIYQPWQKICLVGKAPVN